MVFQSVEYRQKYEVESTQKLTKNAKSCSHETMGPGVVWAMAV